MTPRLRSVVTLFAPAALSTAACATAPTPPSPHPSPAALAPPSDAGGPSDGGPAVVETGSREERLISTMLRRVEAARGLESKHPVPGVVLDRKALLARVKQHLATELPIEAIHNEGLALALFGFIPTAFDYEGAEYNLLEDQLAGYYEPEDGTMYMAGDLAEPEAEATLAHELVHALQDQRWDLASRCKYQPGAGDRSETVSALAEGDATSAMFDVLIAQVTGQATGPGARKSAVDIADDELADRIREGMEQGPGAAAPRIMRASLAAPYIYGTQFVHALRRRGGWAEVDRAWNDAPATTEQILHVEKWLSREPALPVPAPGFAALGEGWHVTDDDSEGELGARLAFEEWTDLKTAADLASGWGGDRGVLLVNGDRAAYAWRLRYDAASGASAHRAAAVFRALKRGLEKEGPLTVAEASFVCRARPDRGPMAMGVVDGDLAFTLGPAHVEGTWKSAGDCALARRWMASFAKSSSAPPAPPPSGATAPAPTAPPR
jgi:hypothetical protein